MSDQRLSDEDVERVSDRVAGKILRRAGIGLLILFVVLPLLGFMLLYTYRAGGP